MPPETPMPRNPGMRFVTNRPQYAAGTVLPGYPAIQSVLYSDLDCEVYLLESSSRGCLIAIGLRSPGEGVVPPQSDLEQWMAEHGVKLVGRRVISSHEAAKKTRLELFAKVSGTWMAQHPKDPLRECELYSLLYALLELGFQAAAIGFNVAMVPPLLWLDGPAHAARLSSIFMRKTTISESEVVRQIAATFLWHATGIDALERRALLDHERVEQWCQNADAGLARVIERCLDTTNPIGSLSDLRNELDLGVARLAAVGRIDGQSLKRYVAIGPYRVVRFSSDMP